MSQLNQAQQELRTQLARASTELEHARVAIAARESDLTQQQQDFNIKEEKCILTFKL